MLKASTMLSAPWCSLGAGWVSALSGSHFSQRSGSEVTLLVHRAARASDSSSHHTNCSSSAGWREKNQVIFSGWQKLKKERRGRMIQTKTTVITWSALKIFLNILEFIFNPIFKVHPEPKSNSSYTWVWLNCWTALLPCWWWFCAYFL